MSASATLLRLLALLREYDAEPELDDSDAVARRDLDYFDRMVAILGSRGPDTSARTTPQADAHEYRVRWEIDIPARSHVDAARQARNAQLRPDSLATVFDVVRRDPAVVEPDWSLAESIDLSAHARSDHLALDEIARVLRAGLPSPDLDLRYVAELVELTGRDVADPVTDLEAIDWR